MILTIISSLSLGIWLFLLLFWGQFWRANCRVDRDRPTELESYPSVCAVVPARNESEVIDTALSSLLTQDYRGRLTVVLVDDNSSDRTGKIVRQTATKLGAGDRLTVVTGQPLKSGWKGKLWAMHQGVQIGKMHAPDYWLFTDADIQHDRKNLAKLVAKAEAERLDLVSLMVHLRCQSWWEKLLIPAFVFFFQKLYPFPYVNNPTSSVAAAAGGCMLVSNKALAEIGGIAAIKEALIDDCTLAHKVKSTGKKIWLGLSETTSSLRGYDNLRTIWQTIARTAYTQLNYSPLLLVGTVIGMTVIYLAAPLCLIIGGVRGDWLLVLICLATWLLMSWAYLPTLRLYKRSAIWTLCLPAIAFLYTLMTIDSGIKYYRGLGGAWKGRTYN